MTTHQTSLLLLLLLLPLLPLLPILEDRAGAVATTEAWSSNLPICIINTDGKEIPRKPVVGSAEKISARLMIIYNKDESGRPLANRLTDTNYHFYGNITVWHRGRSSAEFPKRSFSINLEKKSELMDMPKGKTFALYAPYADKSLMRNNLAYQLANDIASTSDDGGYNSWWAPRTKYCELFIIAAQDEAEYMGVYVFLERIDQQEERVDIRKLQPPKENTSLDSLDISGGYIWQRNWVDPGDVTFETPLNRFVVEYPESKDIVPPFLDYLSGFVSDVENELYSLAPDEIPTFQDVFSIKAFIDYHIFFELIKNVDTYRYSTYFYKDASSSWLGGGAMYLGPHWDYDFAFGNVNYSSSSRDTSGWRTEKGSGIISWVQVLWRNQWIRNEIAKRYQELRSPHGALSDHRIFSSIDQYADELTSHGAQARNFAKWDILGKYVWPNPSPIPATFQDEVAELKSWISKRLEWLDAEMPKLLASSNSS